MEKPKILASEILFQGFFSIRQDLIERSDGRKISYAQCILPTDAAIVLAKTPDQYFILNREYRHPTGDYLIGCPGGSLHSGEDPMVGGIREFFEETGYWSDDVRILGTVYPLPGLCNQKITFLLAQNAYPKGPQTLDPFEYIQTERLTHDQLVASMSSGAILDGPLLIALSLLHYKS